MHGYSLFDSSVTTDHGPAPTAMACPARPAGALLNEVPFAAIIVHRHIVARIRKPVYLKSPSNALFASL